MFHIVQAGRKMVFLNSFLWKCNAIDFGREQIEPKNRSQSGKYFEKKAFILLQAAVVFFTVEGQKWPLSTAFFVVWKTVIKALGVLGTF